MANLYNPEISTTLILDSGILPKRIVPLGGILAGAAVGLLIGASVVHMGNQAYSQLSIEAAFFIFFASLIAAVAIHEFGHLLAGRAVGLKFNSVSVGPLSLQMEYGKLTVQSRRLIPALGCAGMHLDKVRRLRRRLLIFVAGGPAANFLSVPMAVCLLNYAFPGLSETWAASFVAEFVFLSILLGLSSLALHGKSMPSDGSRIAMLLNSPGQSRRWLSILALGNQQHNGVEPKLMKTSWLKAATSICDNSVDEFSGNWIAYACASDKKDEPLASSYLERCLELCPALMPAMRDIVAQEAAFFAAWFRHDPDLAAKWTSQIRKRQLVTPLLRIRLQVALDCANLKYDAVLNSWQKGTTAIAKLPNSAIQTQLSRSWEEWRSEILHRQGERA